MTVRAVAAALVLGLAAAGQAHAGCLPLTDDRDPPLSRVDQRALTRSVAGAREAFTQIESFAETQPTWRGQTPAFPADAPITLELHVVGSFGAVHTSVLAWREAAGAWRVARADANYHAPPPPPSPPPPHNWPADQEWTPPTYPDTRFREARGAIAPDTAAAIETLLNDRCRTREPAITPAFVPLRGGEAVSCFDGPLYRLIVRRRGQVSERISQSCQARWRNGQLLSTIDTLQPEAD
ncbi:MAG: hypothetical protein KF700_08595 [Hyphomonadaceae bacterium]|nr:hypothetical protein [Hyphomonadaceae bacterium]